MARRPTTTPATPRCPGFDRAFADVVREGYLTTGEAIARGNREAYALKLQRRHGLTPELAMRVTDNRMRIAEALREMERQRTATEASRPRSWHLPGLILLFIALAAFSADRRWTRERDIGRELEKRSLAQETRRQAVLALLGAELEPAPAPPSRVEIERDPDGWVTRVTASHPDEVLASFCATLIDTGSCASMQIGPTLPASAGRRLGWFMLDNGSPTIWSVQIRRQSRTGRWSVGTGLRPIVPFSLDGAPGDETSEWPFASDPGTKRNAAEGRSAKRASPDLS